MGGKANNSKTVPTSPITGEKNSRLKVRKSAAMSPSEADAAISALEVLPSNPKPLIAPAKFKPETRVRASLDSTPSNTTFCEPLSPPPRTLRRTVSQDSKPRRSRSKESTDSVNSKPSVDRHASITSDRVSPSPPPLPELIEETKAGKSKGDKEPVCKDKGSGGKAVAATKPRQPKRGQKRKSTDNSKVCTHRLCMYTYKMGIIVFDAWFGIHNILNRSTSTKHGPGSFDEKVIMISLFKLLALPVLCSSRSSG